MNYEILLLLRNENSDEERIKMKPCIRCQFILIPHDQDFCDHCFYVINSERRENEKNKGRENHESSGK